MTVCSNCGCELKTGYDCHQFCPNEDCKTLSASASVDALSEVELVEMDSLLEWLDNLTNDSGPTGMGKRIFVLSTKMLAHIRATKPVASDEVGRLTNFLNEAARYFEKRDTKGEDKAHWANIYNAENCRKAASLLQSLAIAVAQQRELHKKRFDAYTTEMNRAEAAEAEVEKLTARVSELEIELSVTRVNLEHTLTVDRMSTAYAKGVEDAAKIVAGFSTAQNYLPEGVDGGWLAIRDLDMARQISALNQEERHG